MRVAGVLMPLSSLPSKHGVGDMGTYGYEFIKLLKEARISIWQVLPLNPLGYGNSPYQPYSSFAGDEIYISLDKLYENGLLDKKADLFNEESSKIEYKLVREFKEKYLKIAYNNFINKKMDLNDEEYKTFIKQKWLKQYGLYLTLKKKNKLLSWNEWPKEEQNYIFKEESSWDKYLNEIKYEIFIQYIFYKQWMDLKEFANDNEIKIMGDIPFYVGVDSLDVWANQENFLLDENGNPSFVAGVPPDFFSETGQRWGNPIYDWDQLERDGYRFWIDRMAYNAKLFDLLRIDHFRAFDTYWSIPAESETAVIGEWLEAPGYDVLSAIFNGVSGIKVVVEDLGELRPEVLDLRDYFNLTGMSIAQFNFRPEIEEHDFLEEKNIIIYTGTHDNQTSTGWFESQSKDVQEAALDKLEALGYDETIFVNKYMHYTLDSAAKIVILPIQDILELGDEARINSPGTLGSPNWEWKLVDFELTKGKIQYLKELTYLSKRAKKD
ncbi:MAG TPA: 4-alpha-glucanotransferase [Clostridiales bacterium]|nr:4-alpha-glucanotransferase [Clostridiales bacterium]